MMMFRSLFGGQRAFSSGIILSSIVVVIVFAVDGVVGLLRDEMRLSSTTTEHQNNNEGDKRKLMRMKNSKSMKKTPPPPKYKTIQLRAVQLEPQVFANAITDFGQSLVGSVSIFTAPYFRVDEVPVDAEGKLIGDVPPLSSAMGKLTASCTITEGTVDFTSDGEVDIDLQSTSCTISTCETQPFVGGCAFYQSGGLVDFENNADINLLPLITASSTSGTGILNFGVESFISIKEISGSLAEATSVLDVSATVIIGDTLAPLLERNSELAKNVPGFLPAEAAGELDGTIIVGQYSLYTYDLRTGRFIRDE